MLSPRIGRRFLAAALGLVASTLLGGAVVEAAARMRMIPPRVGVVRASVARDFHVTPDGLLMYSMGEQPVRCAARRPGAPTLAFLGSSITAASGLTYDDAFPEKLEQRIARPRADAPCVDNFAEPGFGVEQLWAVARERVPETHPRLLVWELWDPEKYYSVVGDIAFDARSRVIDARGVPVVPHVPEALGDALFRWSWGYQYAALAFAPTTPSSPDPDRIGWICRTVLPDVVRIAALAGTRVVILVATQLRLPLDTLPERDVLDVVACAREQGIDVLSIAELLADQRVEDIRLDPCCHLNARGHALLAERLVPRLGLDAR